MEKTPFSLKIPMKLTALQAGFMSVFTSQALSWSPNGKILAHLGEMGNAGNMRGINL
jgi:hypothetical protein